MLEKNITVLSQYSLLDNNLENILKAVIVFLILLGLFKIFQKIILKRLKNLAQKTKTDIDDTLIQIFKSIKPPFYSFIAFYLAIQILFIGNIFQKVINIVLTVCVVYQVIISLQVLIDYLIKKNQEKEKTRETQGAFILLGKIIKGVLWTIGFLLVLSNLGVNVNSLIAGLGIGGVAIALALQNILGDLFSSFTIYFDKPFVVGDFIVIGEQMGVVKKIGLKTTRIQALQGEELIFSNNELTSARIQNFKKLKERRIAFTFGVVYETSMEKIKIIPEIIKKIIDTVDKARFDRAHFVQFDNSSLSFETVYYAESEDYNVYRNIHQEILFKIKQTFEKEKISMAYPTQTLYFKK
ncbi:mechanosensitive ion channel family protein [Patescibacteria group bacterium]|nr:mechanosensitive ion channel family protein [Patescibacteria group bacterium]